MNSPMKVLLVQRRNDQGRLRQALQQEFTLDFEWHRLSSDSELRAAAAEYAPSVVLSADDMLAGSPRATLQVLDMLGKQPPQLLVCEMCEESAPWNSVAADITAPWLRPAFDDTVTGLVPHLTETSPSEPFGLPADRPRLPATLRSNLDAVLLLDGNGWVTDLNPHAQRLLGVGSDQRPKAQAHLEDLILALKAGGEGRCTTLPLVALNLNGLLLLNAQSERFGDAALDLIASVVQPQFARCGMLARVGSNQYVAIVPHMSPSADAAVSVGGGKRGHAESDLSMVFGSDSINDADISGGPRERPRPVPRIVPRREPLPSPEAAPDLGDAVEWHALSVHFQPQYELQSGRGCGAEALARWTLASGRNLEPVQFIPIAERSGKLGALDAWVLKTACTAALQWRGPAADRRTLSVNVLERQIGTDYTRLLEEVLRASRFPAHRLELEIGEEPILSHSARIKACLHQWKDMGVRIAVNHRSANYSALEYLARGAVDRLKIDKALIQRMTQHRPTAATVQAIIALCAEFKVDVVAEGVETSAQMAMLRDFDCPKIQGFLLARPMPVVQAQLVLGKTWGNLKPAATASRVAIAN